MAYTSSNAKPIGELCHIIDCEHKTAPYIDSSQFLVVRTCNVRNGKLILDGIKYTTKEGFQEWTQRAKPEHGDVFFTREAPAGETCLVPKDVNVCMGQRMVLLRPKRDIVNPIFLSLYLTTGKCKNNILRLSIGTTVSRINIADIRKLRVESPSLPEQTKIAQILSTWDRAIDLVIKLADVAQQRRNGLIQRLLHNKEWTLVSLADIGEISGAGVDKKSNPDEKPIRLLNYLDVLNRDFIFDRELERWVTATDRQISNCDVRKGDVFFTPSSETRDDIAHSAVATEDIASAVYSYHVVRLRLKQPWDINFRAYAFKTSHFYKQAYQLCEGSGQRYV